MHSSSHSHDSTQGPESPVEEKGKHESLALDGAEEELCGNDMSGLDAKKRRLRVDQVKALETDFHVHNKLDPERKQRLAQDLGLQPRQVAVWFQNRRARRKTKQIEHDFGSLRARHDDLKLSCDALRRDNEFLQSHIRELEAKLEGKAGEGKRPRMVDGSSDKDSSLLFNGEAVLHEHCLSECRTEFASAGGRGYLDEDVLSGDEHGSSFYSQQPAQSLYCCYSDDWD